MLYLSWSNTKSFIKNDSIFKLYLHPLVVSKTAIPAEVNNADCPARKPHRNGHKVVMAYFSNFGYISLGSGQNFRRILSKNMQDNVNIMHSGVVKNAS